jgi:hypothetical protein
VVITETIRVAEVEPLVGVTESQLPPLVAAVKLVATAGELETVSVWDGVAGPLIW